MNSYERPPALCYETKFRFETEQNSVKNRMQNEHVRDKFQRTFERDQRIFRGDLIIK